MDSATTELVPDDSPSFGDPQEAQKQCKLLYMAFTQAKHLHLRTGAGTGSLDPGSLTER